MEIDPELGSPGTAAAPTKKSGEKRKKEKITASIEVIHDHPDKTAPLVGYFPSGYHPVADTDGPAAGVTVYRNKNKSKSNRLELNLSPPGSTVVFAGSSFQGEPTAVQPCTYALGVLDKESGSLKIVPVAANKIFRLEPRVGSILAEDERSELKGDISAKEKADKVRELTNLYGTKRSITQAKKLQSLRQEVDPNSENDLDRKIKEVAINKWALESTGGEIARNIPTYNSAAIDPKDAYPLEKIILGGEWDYIRDIIELIECGEIVSEDSYTSFVCKRIHKIKEAKDEVERDALGCILSYINHLVKFKERHTADGFRSAKKHHFPPILQQRFSSLFIIPEAKCMTVEKINLLVSHVLVLRLFVDDFLTDPADIASDLRMSSVELRRHFENLGCKVSTKYAKLPVPLKFPEMRRRRRV